MADIFISYKREDKALAEDTIHRLKEAGFSVWYDERITPHTSWDETIEAEIAAAKAVVVLWTPRSVMSEWVRTEADYAKEHGKLVPVMLETCAVPLAYRRTQTADLTGWNGNPADRNFQKVIEWVRGLVSGTAAAPGAIGPSTGSSYSTPKPKSRGMVRSLALLLILAGGGYGLWATNIIGPDTFNQLIGTDRSNAETAATVAATEPVAPEPVPLAPTCIDVAVQADRKDFNGDNWDIPIADPDIKVTSESHPDVRFRCNNDYRCDSSGFANPESVFSIDLLIMDDDIDADDTMGSGACDIPSNDCRVGRTTVTISAC